MRPWWDGGNRRDASPIAGSANGVDGTFRALFNKRPKADYSDVTMRDHTMQVRQGGESLTASKARRLNKPHNDQREMTVAPGSKADVTVAIGPFTARSETGTVCTAVLLSVELYPSRIALSQ